MNSVIDDNQMKRKKKPYLYRLIVLGIKCVWFYFLFPTDYSKSVNNTKPQ